MLLLSFPMAYTTHRAITSCLASATDLRGSIHRVVKGTGSLVLVSNHATACRMPRQSSQCLRAYGASANIGPSGLTELSNVYVPRDVYSDPTSTK